MHIISNMNATLLIVPKKIYKLQSIPEIVVENSVFY